MKRLLVLLILIVTIITTPSVAFTQGLMGTQSEPSPVSHTAREEAEGKAVWEKLQAKKTTCADLSNENFGSLGEYFMGQMMGNSHEAMNNMMIRMMGEQGEADGSSPEENMD